MPKRKKLLFIITLLISFTIITKDSLVNARPVIHKITEHDSNGGSNYSQKACHFISVQNSVVRIRIDTSGEHQKSGFLYKIADSEGQPLFCLDPDVGRVASTYDRGSQVSRSGDEGYYYKAYQYYLDNLQYANGLAFAQATFWYLAQHEGAMTEQGLTRAIFSFMMSNQCYKYENEIKQGLLSDNFTCSKFLGATDDKQTVEGNPYVVSCDGYNEDNECIKGKRICTPGYLDGKSCKKYLRRDKSKVSFDDYLNLFMADTINTIGAGAGISAQKIYEQTLSDAKRVAHIIWTYNSYPYPLYYWNPNGYGQRFIGIYGCPPGDVTKKCPSKMIDLYKKYPNESQRTMSNTEYYNKLKEILTPEIGTYSKITNEDLTNPDFVANPPKSCKKGGDGDGTDCPTDLIELLYYQEQGTAGQSAFDALFAQMLVRYPDEFNGNSKNPNCGDIEEFYCEPEYEDNDCNFNHTERTLYMKDSSSKTCWNERQVAYKIDDVTKSSVFEGVSPYCTVTCHELFQVDFPPGKDNIKAGEEFFWGFGEPAEAYFGNVNASKNCYTSYPNYNQFLADWNANEENIKQAYANYLAQKSYNSQTDSDVKEANSHCCISGYSSATEGHRNYSSQDINKCISQSLWCTCYNGTNETPILGTGWDVYCPSGYSFYEVSLTSGEPEKCTGGWGKTYKLDAKSETYNGKTGTSNSHESGCVSSKPSASSLHDSSEESSRLTSLNSLIAGRSTLKANLEKCYSNSAINENTIYHNVTTIALTYTDPANTNRNIDGATLINKDNWSSFNSYGVVDQSGTITLNCSDTPGVAGGDTCGNVIQKYIEYYWDFVGLWKYYYNTEIFSWKFLLENGHAVNIKKFDESYKSFHSADGTVGFIASFKLITGFYEFAKVDVQGFGSDGHFNELYRAENEGSDIYTYSCPFKVTNEIYGSECRYDCDYNVKTCKITADSPEYCKREVKGLDIVYRIIELTSAEEAAAGNINTVFPGIVGTGRKLGKNWNDFYTYNRTKYNNITTYNNIYDGGPIYTIDLTPALIQEIRADNATYRNHKDGETNKPMDPYTSMKYTNGTKKYLCSDDTPKDQTCASEWLSNLSQRGLLTGEYGEIKDTKARLEAIRKAKDSTEASGTKNVTVVGGA